MKIYNDFQNGILISIICVSCTPLIDINKTNTIASASPEEASLSSRAMFLEGESAISKLRSYRGNTTPYCGNNLGDGNGGGLIYGYSKQNVKSGRAITVEVAALYLISSIYAERMDFASSPYLCDMNLSNLERRALNTTELIDRAWESVEAWDKDRLKYGIGDLKKRKIGPLSFGHVAFW